MLRAGFYKLVEGSRSWQETAARDTVRAATSDELEKILRRATHDLKSLHKSAGAAAAHRRAEGDDDKMSRFRC